METIASPHFADSFWYFLRWHWHSSQIKHASAANTKEIIGTKCRNVGCFFFFHSKISTSSTEKYAIMLPSVSLYSGPIHTAARRVFPCWNTAFLLAITSVAPLLAMGCLQPVCILCAALIYFGETMNIKCLCRTLTWCVQRQMSVAILGVDREEVSEGTAQAMKDTFISVSFGKGCSKKC